MARIKSKKYDGVYTNKLQNGDISYYVTYKDIQGKLKWVKIGTNKKNSNEINEQYCNIKRNEFINKMNLGEDPSAKKKKKDVITFDDVASKYFSSVENINRNNAHTKAKYENHIKEFIGKLDISEIEHKSIEQLQKLKQKTHSPKTVNTIIQLIGTIFNYGIKKENLKLINPITKVTLLPVDNQRDKFLNREEIKSLLNVVAKDKELDLFVRLSLSTGGRVSTILNIKKKDIDLNNHTINLFDFKNACSYMGFITDDLIPILEILVSKINTNDFLFKNNKRLDLQSKLKDIYDELFNQGLEIDDSKNRVVSHTLRHTFASHLAINGTPIYTIQKLMNHKDIKMTLRYAKLSPDSGKENVKGLYNGRL
jgi:site-specific recombinase XerD